LERTHPEFNDALITAVDTSAPVTSASGTSEADSQQQALHDAMLARAVELAAARAERAESKRVFNFKPLWRSTAIAFLAVLSILLFAALARPTFTFWTSRLLLASDAPWPRLASIEVLEFPEGERKVAQGTDVTIRVRASASASRVTPNTCTIDFRTADGDRGRVNMSRDGDPQDGYQYYRYEGQPFQGMLEPIEFDVIGYDHRVSDYRVNVVPSPSITEVAMRWQPPAYMKLPARTQTWRPGTSVPAGSDVVLVTTSTKPLREVVVQQVERNESQTIAFGDKPVTKQFEFPLGVLGETTTLEFALLDTDEVVSEQPYRVTINALEDLEPTVAIGFQGIGTAITPQARIPVTGEVKDDYQIQDAWFQLNVPDRSLELRMPLPRRPNGEVDTALDLRRQRAEVSDEWTLSPGEKVIFRVRASDYYDLDAEPHIGQSDEVTLDVVTPDELLALLEARELGLKRRFEQTLSELEETRDSLLRLQAVLAPPASSEQADGDQETQAEGDAENAGSDQTASGDTGGTRDGQDTASGDSVQQATLLRLRAQRAQQQAVKSQQEVDGVAGAFAEIREELTNNRVDTPQRNERLQDQIVTPLRLIVADQFPRWIDQLALLEQQLEDSTQGPVQAREAVRQNNELILALQEVLQKMIELETYNELVELVRSIIAEQEAIETATEAAQKDEARSLLED
jgi:hypothetical protein